MAKKVTQGSEIRVQKDQPRGTLRALGLRGIGSSRVHDDTPTLRGMLHQVGYLLKVDDVEES